LLSVSAHSSARPSGPSPTFLFTAAARVRRPPFFSERVARNLLHSRSRVLVPQGELARSVFGSMLRDFPRSVRSPRELDGLLRFRLSFSSFWSIFDRVCSSSSQRKRAAHLHRLDLPPCVTARFFDSVARYFVLGAGMSVSCLDISVSCLDILVSCLHISVSGLHISFSCLHILVSCLHISVSCLPISVSCLPISFPVVGLVLPAAGVRLVVSSCCA
jgi:hypothetical protein